MDSQHEECEFDDSSPSLYFDAKLTIDQLHVRESESELEILDDEGGTRVLIDRTESEIRSWSDLIPGSERLLKLAVFPKREQQVTLVAYDQFFPSRIESVGLGFVSVPAGNDTNYSCLFSFCASPNERFVGTGERFAKLDLAGRTIQLVNTDGLGNNSRRTYKNVPFYMSSLPYGMYINTSSATSLSFTDISGRAVQGCIEHSQIDLFIIGGETPTQILYNYRMITGHPPKVPVWSYGVWMSRMTYFSADEIIDIAEQLRDLDLPSDVMHIDTGWFKNDWICEWKFSEERFPDPAYFVQQLLDIGYRVTLWQTPTISKKADIYRHAKENRFLPPSTHSSKLMGSDFDLIANNEQIDFTYPGALDWYQNELLAPLLQLGIACIKTDFGEDINMDADYSGMTASRLRNCYPVLYQKAAYDITEQINGCGLTWSRAGWAGCQRYPVHWAGDTASTWDGMAAAVRGGLHLAMSGFAYWAHDIPGFHGVPDFMNSWPTDELYLRWTQLAVFCSHMRYHGTSPREPYEYPNVLEHVRGYLKLRYALIPYLLDEADNCIETGSSIFAPMCLHAPSDPVCWMLDDQFFCGRTFIVAPIMNEDNIRDIYLPTGDWIDLWSGELITGECWVRNKYVPLHQIPVYVRSGTKILVYPHHVSSTNDMNLNKCIQLCFDESYISFSRSILGELTMLS
ncbi:alpha-xylosidase [Mucisphaera sp.]|uniref:glycoside hydrolase family 31 protein n=1 Tax=Mucisphaera sp. TaxID=2913024 RepID=UPI003D0EED33